MSSESEDDDDFTPAVTPESDATDSLDCSVEESKGPSKQACLLFIIFITKF